MVVLVEDIPQRHSHGAPLQENTPSSKTRRNKNKRGKKEQNPKSNGESKQLTPYQGPRKTFGLFHCEKCNTEWGSANSWANCYQKCNSCNGKIYPYRQFRPRYGHGRVEGRPPHPQDKCQKCMKLGTNCAAYDVHETKEESGSNQPYNNLAREE